MPEPKDIYKPRNWKAYNKSLCQRGCLTLWLSDSLYRHWSDISRQGKVVGEKYYPDMVIELCLTIKQVYGLPLRQCTGFLESIFALMGLSYLAVPDYSTLSRRSSSLTIKVNHCPNDQKVNIAVDSTGLKVYGEGEWKVRKHGVSKRRIWRKMHLGVDVTTQQIVSCELTHNSVDDAEMTENLIDIDREVDDFIGDGAYDDKKSRKAVHAKGGKVIVPPPKNAVIHQDAPPELSSRNQDIGLIAQIGRNEWKKEVGYHKRSLAEVAMFRYKTTIGNTLSARRFDNQVTEIKIGCHILNVFNGCGMPNAYKV